MPLTSEFLPSAGATKSKVCKKRTPYATGRLGITNQLLTERGVIVCGPCGVC
ncbi:hypothetical protein I79_013715 [Cricetulus griseus]|uniref:Uncharacterized protein n=1 Tax=Cricetulus griseus TaxID=10029 RepID=G3HS89_CRIGR|nr:hypothetical protein I79_013715 [Cricetulus griseus]